MWRFAWRNLLSRPVRTALALVGLSIPILGILGLFSVSGGLRNTVGDTLGQIQGVVVMRENSPTPVLSSVEASLVGELWTVPGVSAVAPEIWGLPPTVEGASLFGRAITGAFTKSGKERYQSLFETIAICGQDIPSHEKLRSSVFRRNLVEGRFLKQADQGLNRVVISRKMAKDFAGENKPPKKIGDSIQIGSGKDAENYEIIGLYDTGSMFLDVVIVTDIEVARRILKEAPGKVSSIYVESRDPSKMEEVSEQIEARFVGIDARTMDEFSMNATRLLGQMDLFLLMIVSLALLVGVVGIINTMLMSTTERYTEFGVLRTNGWSQRNVLELVTLESAFLGVLAGLLGCVMTMVGAVLINAFLSSSGGLRLAVTPNLMLMGLVLSVVMGTLGGLYPAWRAARLVPMEAIRLGSN